MESEKKNLLVAWDFTLKAENAFLHAVNYTKKIPCNIILVHIVPDAKKCSEIQSKLDKITEELAAKHGVKLQSVIKEGTIFKTINETAEKMDALLVFMGTHGMQGMQKMTGSKALRVMAGAPVPFILVQAPPSKEGITDVVFPVDHTIETNQKVKYLNFIREYYQCKVHIVTPNFNPGALRNKVKGNLNQILGKFKEKNISYEVIIGADEGDFIQAINNFSKTINADLIIIMLSSNLSFWDYLTNPVEQRVMFNKNNIPVMCINPRTDIKIRYGL